MFIYIYYILNHINISSQNRAETEVGQVVTLKSTQHE